jgi:RNA polymerase sigma factor (TIGR02999 family)
VTDATRTNAPAPDPTEILQRLNRDGGTAAAELLPLVYDELRRLAATLMRGERSDHTLQPTALVHEAYVRLIRRSGDDRVEWKNRSHFMGVAATAMRRVLVDHARARDALKRGGEATVVQLNEAVTPSGATTCEVISLDDALHALAALSPRMARVVELRFFAGLTIEQTAAVLDTSHTTVEGDWKFSRAWLARRLATAGG